MIDATKIVRNADPLLLATIAVDETSDFTLLHKVNQTPNFATTALVGTP